MATNVFCAFLLLLCTIAHTASSNAIEDLDGQVKFAAFRNESDLRAMCGEVDNNNVLTWSSPIRSLRDCSIRCSTYDNCKSFNFMDVNELQPQPVCEMFAGLPSNFIYREGCSAFRMTEKPKALCPTGFTYSESANGCYLLVNQAVPWSDVASLCSQKAVLAHSLVINNAAETVAIQNLMQTSDMTGCGENRDVWTAGQKQTHESSVWQWKTALYTTDISYTAWGPGQPDNTSDNEDCIEINSYNIYLWNDKVCDAPLCYICEVDMD